MVFVGGRITVLNETEQSKPEKLAFSIPETAWVLGDVSQNHVRNLISEGSLRKVQIGRRVMVSADSIKQLIEAGGTLDKAA
jgi:excisionase family DNA binding protein